MCVARPITWLGHRFGGQMVVTGTPNQSAISFMFCGRGLPRPLSAYLMTSTLIPISRARERCEWPAFSRISVSMWFTSSSTTTAVYAHEHAGTDAPSSPHRNSGRHNVQCAFLGHTRQLSHSDWAAVCVLRTCPVRNARFAVRYRTSGTRPSPRRSDRPRGTVRPPSS
jgi:hypothetical protein